MAVEKLKLEIGAEVAGAVNGVRQVEKSLKGLDTQTRRSAAVTQNFNQVLREMPNFAIDARIGVMSLSNNLGPLFESIGNARKQGQGFTAVLKSLGASLFSVGGIATIAVTLFTAFGDKLFGAAKSTKDAKKATDEYVESLGAVRGAMLAGEMAAQKEITSLKSLYDATQNTSLSLKERKIAVDELQRQFPAYFGNLRDEDILAGNAANAYNRLAKSLVASAQARAMQDKIAKNAEKILENEQKRADLQAKLPELQRKAQQEALRVQGNANAFTPLAAQIGQQDGSTKALKGTQEEINALLREEVALRGESMSIENKINDLVKDTSAGILTSQVGGRAAAAGKNVKIDLNSDTHMGEKPLDEYFREKKFGTNEPLKVAVKEISVESIPTTKLNLPKGMTVTEFEALNKALDNILFKGALAKTVFEGVGNAFAAFGMAVVNGANAMQAFGQSLKQMLAQMIGQMLKAAALAAILSVITGGASGGGLSFLGAFKGIIGGSIPGLAQGGIVPPGYPNDTYPARLSSNEAVIPLNKLSSMIGGMGGGGAISVEHRIQGRELVLLINRELKAQGRVG